MFATADDAENAFYRAFESHDLDLMMQVWADDAEIICVHPLGERLTGPDAVRDSWQAMFGSSRSMHFRIVRHSAHGDADVVMHQLDEIIRIGDRVHPPVAATNVYRRTASGWRMVLHHASPTPGQAHRETASLH